jgi:1-(5-phosphoribosyl)-5-[(5-phosphoribosylamino)methylideneamino] imidazole-4-carboxamide isomerase/N-(5'phosphoribosyl)anthranilate isomerase
MKVLDLYPAVDIKNGKAARLTKGQLDSTENFGDPVEVVKQFIEAGSKWIHLVDLDAAFDTGTNRQIIKEITALPNIAFQLSGGINNQENLDFAISTNAKQINLATSALHDLKWVEEVLRKYGGRLSISLDVEAGSNQLIARGSGDNLGDLFQMIKRLDSIGCHRYILTDINADGALSGSNFDLIKKVQAVTDAAIISSGGVSSVDDLIKLREFRLAGVVLGKALYEGQIDLLSALTACYK